MDFINGSLRGEGTLSWGSSISEEWKTRYHKIFTTEEFNLMDALAYSSYEYGFITGIDKSGSMFAYELTELERV